MAEGPSRKAPEGYMTMAEARARLGVARATMVKIVREAGVQIYDDPRDARIKLLRVEDVEALGRPRPRSETTDEGKAEAA